MRVIVKMIVMVIIRVKIMYINVLVRLVSINPRVMLNLIDYPPHPSKVDRVNENDKGNKNDSKDNDDKIIIRVSVIEMIVMIVMIMKVIMKIECIGVIVRLVSRRGGSLNWT